MKSGDLLRQNLTPIFQRWERCVRSEIETARTHHTITLHDHLPHFLDALCETLNEPHDDEHADYQVDMSKVHGETRADLHDYDLDDVLQEYSLLRRVIVAFFFENGVDDRLTHRIVHRSLDLAMATAGQQFMDDRKSRLEKALKSQKELNVELDKFVAIAAHDLRSPIATLVGFLEIAVEKSNEPVYDEKALLIAKRSLKMIESLLQRSRIRNGILDHSVFTLKEIVKEVETALLTEISQKSARIVCADDAKLVGDRNAISQLIQNLVANSLKFSQQSVTPLVTINSEIRDQFIEIHIFDNGIGIAPESREEIFRAFHREGEKSGALGLGLGLDTCMKIAEAHNGTLEVADADRGAHFILSLPKERPDQKKGPPSPASLLD